MTEPRVYCQGCADTGTRNHEEIGAFYAAAERGVALCHGGIYIDSEPVPEPCEDCPTCECGQLLAEHEGDLELDDFFQVELTTESGWKRQVFFAPECWGEHVRAELAEQDRARDMDALRAAGGIVLSALASLAFSVPFAAAAWWLLRVGR